MQRVMDQVSQSCDIMNSQSAQKKTYNEPTITVNGHKLKVVDNYKFCREVHVDDDVTARIAKASVSFGRRCANIWERNGIKLDTRLKVYKALVLPTLLYVRPGQYTSIMQRDLTFPIKLFEKALKNQVARQDSRHGGPEESREAKHAYIYCFRNFSLI